MVKAGESMRSMIPLMPGRRWLLSFTLRRRLTSEPARILQRWVQVSLSLVMTARITRKMGKPSCGSHVPERKGKEAARIDKGENSGDDAAKSCLSAQLPDVVYLSLEKEETNVVKPSICSLNSGFMDASMASNTKSIRLRLANLRQEQNRYLRQ